MRLNRWFLLLFLLLVTTFSLGEDIAPGKAGDELVEHLRANYQPTSVRNYHDARLEMFSDIDNEDGKVVLVYTGEEFATTGIPDHRVANRFLNGKSPWEKLWALNYQNHYHFLGVQHGQETSKATTDDRGSGSRSAA